MIARKMIFFITALTLLLAACAPDDLDITPSPTPTETPLPTPTRAPTATPDPDADPADAEAAAANADMEALTGNAAILEEILAAIPGEIPAGQVVWRRTGDEVDIREEDSGIIGIVDFTEAGGSVAELWYGVFDSEDAVVAYYDAVAGRVRTLENAESRANFSEPNLFGGGTYGSDAIFQLENYYVRVSVPQFSSTLGDPLSPLGRQALGILTEATGVES